MICEDCKEQLTFENILVGGFELEITWCPECATLVSISTTFEHSKIEGIEQR